MDGEVGLRPELRRIRMAGTNQPHGLGLCIYHEQKPEQVASRPSAPNPAAVAHDSPSRSICRVESVPVETLKTGSRPSDNS